MQQFPPAGQRGQEVPVCDNLTQTELPLDGNAEDNILFKVYMRESGLKIDFLMRYKGQITFVEVKSTTGNIKSTKTILKNKNVYHVNSAIKLGKYNVGRDGETLTLPLYMSFLLTAY